MDYQTMDMYAQSPEFNQAIANLNNGSNKTFSTICSIILIVAMWMIFTKAGEKGWKSLIPVLNIYTLYKICWKKSAFWIVAILTALEIAFVGFALLSGILSMFIALVTEGGDLSGLGASILLLAFAGINALAIAIIRLVLKFKEAKAFGKGTGFGLGLVFLEPIFALLLAFGGSKYIGPNGNPQLDAPTARDRIEGPEMN